MGDFFFDESEDGYGRVFVPRGPWETKYTDLVVKESVPIVRLSASAGWRGSDLGFLEELHELRGIEIYSWDVRDASVISSLSELRLVGLECALRRPIDFTALPRLEVAKVTWRRALDSLLERTNLRHMNLVNWPATDLQPLAKMTRLSKLLITSRKVSALRGIGPLNALEWLDLNSCQKLSSLGDLRSCGKLKRLEITSCKSVRDISAIGHLRLLRELHLDDGGEIETLMPIQECKLLEVLSFFGTTRIVDGKLSAIEALPNLQTLRFAPRRHYDRTREELLDRRRQQLASDQ
jgi:hypothetical protein